MDPSLEKNDNKKITIQGTNNRYQIKKLVQTKEKKQRRVASEWRLPDEYWTHEKQWELLSKNKQEEKETQFFTLLEKELERKINCYKQQDNEKGMWDLLSFITLEKVKNRLLSCQMKCFYCLSPVFLFYQMVRENKQWTLDRIDNNLGHNENNVVIACLECNLKRRRTNQDKFLFTKQLKIKCLDGSGL